MEKWRVWDKATSYGETLYDRAVGQLPEMESSKAVAKIIKGVFKSDDKILDVGCGAGHYLRSLRRELGGDFSYTGVDATKNYIDLAQKAFQKDSKAQFRQADIFDLGLDSAAYDIVTCNNVLQHLPSIQKPLSELVRVAKRKLFVRFLVGDRSFNIREVHASKDLEIDESGEPINYNFFNIYSKDYVEKLLSRMSRVKNFQIKEDFDFDPQKIMKSGEENRGAFNASVVIGKYQVNGYILQPWAIVEVDL
jgi:ubiquinone/menaquinone biosynthesis C-methylase UbiE